MNVPTSVPSSRVETLNSAPVDASGAYILVWMVASRRVRWSWMLQHARDRASELGVPLLVLECLRIDYPWASPRMHGFILDGMRDNASDLERQGVAYYPYVEPTAGAGRGLVERLARHASLVVTDYKPGFFQGRMQEVLAQRTDCRVERVDDNGILPLQESVRPWPTAHSLRRHLQKVLRAHLTSMPESDPLKGRELPRLSAWPQDVVSRWPMASPEVLAGDMSSLPLSGPSRVLAEPGGSHAAERAWAEFCGKSLDRYTEDRNRVDSSGTTRLSAHLHFGHISSAQMVVDALENQGWTLECLSEDTRGSRSGWWGVSSAAESFLDQVITWRELGHIYCHHVPNFDQYESLPDWALVTLEAHADDPRPFVYSVEQLEECRTHDRVWNAAQAQLRSEGRIHNYLRMLWGKKILEWSAHPRDALATMIELNNRYALDGRDPNSYSGIAWCLGRFDRAWGPERSIFGKIRYMSSDNTVRKLRLRPYLERWASESDPQMTLV